jgi:hypothetical protein
LFGIYPGSSPGKVQKLIIMYYNYHSRTKQRINNGELEDFKYVEKYKNISPCLLLYFNTEPKIRPIREHRFEEYENILTKKQ